MQTHTRQLTLCRNQISRSGSVIVVVVLHTPCFPPPQIAVAVVGQLLARIKSQDPEEATWRDA